MCAGHYERSRLDGWKVPTKAPTPQRMKAMKPWQAARILGIERSTLDRKLKRYRVSRP